MSHLKNEIFLLKDLLTTEVLFLSKREEYYKSLRMIHITLQQNIDLDILKNLVNDCISTKFKLKDIAYWEVLPLSFVEPSLQQITQAKLLAHSRPMSPHNKFSDPPTSIYYILTSTLNTSSTIPTMICIFANFFLLFGYYVDFKHDDPKIIKVLEKIIYISFLFQLEKYRNEEVRVLALTSPDSLERQRAEFFCKQELS